MFKFLQFAFVVIGTLLFSQARVAAQCPVGVAPSYSSGCTSQYFTSLTAGGVGVVSTISYSASSCVSPFYDLFATQGVTAPTGTTVNINVSRVATFQAYLAVYVDWNNDGIYQTTELVGTIFSMPIGLTATVYSFAIPLTGITTNTNLHMRVFLGEPPAASGPISSINPPCSAKWGQSNDYYIKATCTDPVISVTPASPSVCGATGTATLTASGAGATPTYIWSPSGTLSASTGVSVTATPGTTTTYTVTGYGPGVCAATGTVTVTVDPGFAPVITASGATSFCPGGNVTLSETSGSGVTWQWYNGPTLIAGATNATYLAAPASTTLYSVTGTNAAGCVGTATTTVTVLPTPVAVIAPVGPTTVCSPASVLLNGTPGVGNTYRWFNASGVIAGAVAQTYTVATSGTYSVEVTSAAGCKDTSVGATVTINTPPTASAIASGPFVFCSNNSITLTATATPGYAYQWLDGTTIIAGATNSVFTSNIVGTHDYRVKVTNGAGCSDTTASGLFPVVVNASPVSAITASGPLSFCTGGNVTLSCPSVPGYTYQWFFGSTAASAAAITIGGNAASYTANATGYYYVMVTTPAGCTTNSQATAALVTVVPLPTLLYSTPLSFCWGSNVHFSLGISSSASGITFQWRRDGSNIPGATGNTYDAYLAGVYTCVVSVAGSCVASTPPATVNTFPLPNPVITYSAGKLKTGMTYIAYQWYKELAPIAGATTYMITPTTLGNYSVLVTDNNRCVSKSPSFPLSVVVPNGVHDFMANTSPVIYPNPTTGFVFIHTDQPMRIVISSIDGKQLLEKPAAKEVDVTTLPSGLYIVSLYDDAGNRVLVEKLVKE